jgi:NADPH-dependent 2,4-dienoyl-CoA reductase/sulfur reductase-like enzyme
VNATGPNSGFGVAAPAGNLEFDVVVVGAGPAGLAAACAATESKARVAVVDETPWLGGQIWRGQPGSSGKAGNRVSTPPLASHWLNRFHQSGGILLDRTTVIACPRPGLLLCEHEHGPRQVRWKRLILATGARELFLPFPGWTLPGIMGPGGLQALVKQGWPIAGKRVVIGGSGPLLLAVADGLRKHGAKVLCVYEQAPFSRICRFVFGLLPRWGKAWQAGRLRVAMLGTPYRCGVWPIGAEGEACVQRVKLTNGRTTWTQECDLFACGFGLAPNVELPLALGCELTGDFVWVDDWQTSSVPNIYCAGELTGIGGADCALVEGQIAGYAATGKQLKAQALRASRGSWHRFRSALAAAFALRDELKSLAQDSTLVCRCEDVTLGRMRQFKGWREVKLQTRCGMGACQGRICGAASKVLLGWGAESVRPPILPARIQSLISQPAALCAADSHAQNSPDYATSEPKP